MVFSDLLFVFGFLVISYTLYALMPGIRSRNAVLLLTSLIFYAWGGPLLLVLLIGMTLICYIGGQLIERFPTRRGLWLALNLVICLGLLAVFKYTGFFLSNVQAVFGIPEAVPHITLPIGISFYTFQLLSYVIDVYRGEARAQNRFWMLLLYASLFHQCIAGPIVRYSDVNQELESRRVTREDAARGVTRFACGLAKKAVLANGCDAIVAELVEKPESLSSVPATGIFLAAVCYMLVIYLDFSAYSDMAIGLGLMVGFHYRENFCYPYIADSVTDFWRRWHISLSSFFRDYVYIPLGGNRAGIPRQILNLFAVWFLTGLWHGASWNFVLWGLYYFLFLLVEKLIFKISKTPPRGILRIWRTAYTLTVVFFGWMLFYYTDLAELWVAVKGLLTLNGNPFTSIAVRTAFSDHIWLIAAAVLACLPILPNLGKWFEELRKKSAPKGLGYVSKFFVTGYDMVTAIAPVVLLFLSLLCLVGDSYNPFLYFQF